MEKNAYAWKYGSVGGAVRVRIEKGEDIARLSELDLKKWTVLSCPVNGLEFDRKTLEILDTDSDGKIRAYEVMDAARWLTDVITDPDLLLRGDSSLPLSAFNAGSEEGKTLLKSAKQILSNLGLKKKDISLEDTADNTRIFAGTGFNGDGIITELSSGDEQVRELIRLAVKAVGGKRDRCGVDGVDSDAIEAFYHSLEDYAAWQDEAVNSKDAIFPYGDNTPAAYDAVCALRDKIADWFMRCKLISFDEAAQGALDVSVDRIAAISGGNLADSAEEIAGYPLARPAKDGQLPLKGGINPAWAAAFSDLKRLVFDVDFPSKKSIGEDEWNAVLAKFTAYESWKGSKKGAEVEDLGIEKVRSLLAENRKADLLELVAQDKALETEALSIEKVDKLLHLYRDFYTFLKNYVVFSDFFDISNTGARAMFQAGRLYIDQRSTDLCIRVADMGKSSEMSSLSGMYILFCACSSKKRNETFNIAAVLTDGDVDGLREGKNAIFYDRAGNDWDAVVTKIVDNPISIRQAFWAPYKKIGRWISDKINKNAAAKDQEALAEATAKADAATNGKEGIETVKSSFDIAKFAGIFAAIGMALGFIGQFLVSIIQGAVSLGFFKVILVIIAIMLLISGPSMFLAWRKLRRRDLGPVLNANGWAINSAALVRPKFGKTLTSLAQYPTLRSVDPAEMKKSIRKRFWICFACCVVVALGVLFLTDNLRCIGLPFHKEAPSAVENTEAPAPAAEEGTAALQ